LIIDYSAEEVENYNTGFMKLYRWFTSIVALRKQDTIRRKNMARIEKELRESRIIA